MLFSQAFKNSIGLQVFTYKSAAKLMGLIDPPEEGIPEIA